MAQSPRLERDGVLRIAVTSNGAAIKDSIAIHEVEVRRAVGMIASALIVLNDGDMASATWEVADSETFAPGAAISIKAGYGDDEDVVFEGIVVKIGVRSSDGVSRLHIHCQDKAVKMTIGRRNANYVDKSDSAIMAALCKAHGLASTIDTTDVVYGELVQYYCSDWDFLLSRAEVNGLMVVTDAGKITAKAPDTSASAALIVTWGLDLIDFEADIDARSQYGSVTAVAWDPKTQKVISADQSPIKLNSQGNLQSAALAEALGDAPVTLQSATMLKDAALKAWSKSQQTRSGLARIRGHMTFQGSAKALPATIIELTGVGERYSGDVFVGSITHEIRDGDWTTRAEFGLPARWFAEVADVVAPPASGWLPGAAGLQIGVVTKLDEDPAGEQRVQVDIPVLKTEAKGIWARLLQYHASNKFGAFYIPEVGDEVVVGYFNDDPSNPVILGSLYSSSRAPPYALTAKNDIKALVTRSMARIEIDDADVKITIKTPAENQIIIDDKGKSILLSDQHGNSIKMDSAGITIDSAKDIVMSAKGKITADAKMNIALTATTDLTAKGMNVTAEAQVGITCKGTATAELSASGQTTVRGAMVMIN